MKLFKSKQKAKSNVLCHIPHSSTHIPLKETGLFIIGNSELKKEASKMADLFTDQLFALLSKHTSTHTSNISRIVVDVERFIDDDKESMSKVGMGLAYIKTSKGHNLRDLNSVDKKRLVKEYFIPYHKALTDLASKILNKNKTCLIIDCHSFPDKPRAYEPSKKIPRPDICLGVDSFHTPNQLWESLALDFKNTGYSVQINDPFTGSLVPEKFYRKNKNVHSIMIEVNRKLYMNERTFQKNKNFTKISKEITSIIVKNIQK